MRALRIHGKDVRDVRYEQAPDPTPAIGDVVVEVRAASFTPTELDWPSTWVDRAGRDRAPVVPGHEVSGTVRSLGYGTTGLSEGDEVFGLTDWYRDGALADYVAVEARNLALKPASVPHPEAAALALAGLTAWQALFVHAHLESGQTVVITGASGGVGTVAVQLARDVGARVIAVARSWARDLLDRLGASEIIDVQSLDTSGLPEVDLLFDLVGGELAARCAASVRRGGTAVSAVDPVPHVPGGVNDVFFVVEPDRAQLSELARLTEAGRLRPVIGKVLDMADDPAAAFATKHAGGIPGKIVFRVSRARESRAAPMETQPAG